MPELHRPALPERRAALESFYAARTYLPAWFAEGRSRLYTAVALGALARAPVHGLAAADYDAAWLAGEVAALEAGDTDARRLVRVDLALTVAMLRYLSDLHSGRVTARDAGFRFAPASHRFDAAAVLARALAEDRLLESIDAVEPTFAIYARLKVLLSRYRELASQPVPALPPLPRGVTAIEPGQRYAGAAALASRLALVGDLPGAAVPSFSDEYGGALVGAVRSFQDRHGLVPDGVLGRNTLAELAVPLARRVVQIELAMERLRWVPPLPAGPVVAVNVPSYGLWVFDGAAVPPATVLTMRAIVGRAAAAMQTPIFIGEMRYVEFSPYWNVPPSIQKNELVPLLERDPRYLARHDMEVVGPGGPGAAPEVDAETLIDLRAGAARIRQRPGPKNALGGIKFVLPNTMNIYMHGTPAQELFERSRRDFSHGCIRVADPEALAALVLRDRPEWTPERTRTAMAAQVPVTVSLTRPVPVVIFYTTVTMDSDGRARFLPDVYGYDRKLEDALARRGAGAVR